MDEDEEQPAAIEEEKKDDEQSDQIGNEAENSGRQNVIHEVPNPIEQNDDQINQDNVMQEQKREELQYEEDPHNEQQPPNPNAEVDEADHNSEEQEDQSQQERISEKQAKSHPMEIEAPLEKEQNQEENQGNIEEGQCNEQEQQKQPIQDNSINQSLEKAEQQLQIVAPKISVQKIASPEKAEQQQHHPIQNQEPQNYQNQKEIYRQPENLMINKSQNELALATRLEEQHNANLLLNASHLTQINSLQRKLRNSEQSLQVQSAEISTLKANNLTIRSELTVSKQTNMDLRRKKLQVEQEKNKLSKILQKLQKQNKEQRQKLEEVQKIGDVYLLKNSLDQLQLLTQSQREEIEQLKRSPLQQSHQQDFSQYLNILSNYQRQSNLLREENLQLRDQLSGSQNQLQHLIHSDQQNQQTIATLLNEKNTLEEQLEKIKNQVANWEKKWQSFEDQRIENRRARELEQKVMQYESERHFGDDTELPLIPSLSAREQKDILLREYLILQTRYNEKSNQYQISQAKLAKLEKEYKNKLASSIARKDYNDLAAKYNKAKHCLEGAFTKIKQLRRQEPVQKQVIEEVHQILEGNESHLCQNLIKSFNQQLQHLQSKVVEIEKSDELAEIYGQNKDLKQKISDLEQTLEANQKLLFLINEDNEIKTKLIQKRNETIEKLRRSPSNYNNHTHTDLTHTLEELKRVKDLVVIYQTKNIVFIRENQSLNAQLHHWKHLYEGIKQKLTQKINAELSEPIIQQRQEIAPEVVQPCRQCEFRRLNQNVQPSIVDAETQSENLTDLHYKEIKEMLTALRRVLKLVEAIPESTQRTMKDLSEFKDKYQKMIERYNAKLFELKKERSENDSWRSKTKEELKEQFQDIRDLIANNRLVNALRQAKNLIDYLENDKEKGEQEKDENARADQMEEEHESVEKKSG